MKKFLLLSFVLLLFFAGGLSTAFAEATSNTNAKPDNVTIYIDNQLLSVSVAPVVRNGSTLIPIRDVTESIGAIVTWKGTTREVIIERAATTIVLTIDQQTAMVNGEAVQMPIAPVIINGSTMLPLRFVSETLNQTVGYDGATKSIYITETAESKYDMESWFTGCSTIFAVKNKEEPTKVGMHSRDKGGVSHAKVILSNSNTWNCKNREDVINTIMGLALYGHAENFAATYESISSLSNSEYKSLLNSSDEIYKYMVPLTMSLGKKWGDKQIKAWDYYRMFHVAGWGYVAGYLELQEVYDLMEPVVEELRGNFSSWEEANENYLDGYAWWSGTDVSLPNTEYKKRVAVFESTKNDPTYFNPAVWK